MKNVIYFFLKIQRKTQVVGLKPTLCTGALYHLIK